MKKSDLTKQKIIESTIQLVSQKGYSATSTKEIAEKAGISEATIFKYYKSKDNLLKTIVNNTLNEFYDYSLHDAFPAIFTDAENKNTEKLMKNLISERLDFFNENSQAIQVIFQEMMINKDIQNMFSEKIWSKMEGIADYIFNKGKSEGKIKDIDNLFLRRALFGMLFFSFGFEEIFEDDDYNYSSEKEAEIMLEILFNGIAKNRKE